MSENETNDKRETPRTDAVIHRLHLNGIIAQQSFVDLARQLERELAEAHCERIANSAALHDMTKRAQAAELALSATLPINWKTALYQELQEETNGDAGSYKDYENRAVRRCIDRLEKL